MVSGLENIKKYIPQREPMIMVDRLLSHEDRKSVSGFQILESNVFVDKDLFTEAGLLENMAQTAALSKGYECTQKGEEPPLGFIGAVKSLRVHQLPKIGSQLRTEINIKHEVLNASIVEAQVFCESQIIASCELKIFLNPQIAES